jgi:hypothetical protein
MDTWKKLGCVTIYTFKGEDSTSLALNYNKEIKEEIHQSINFCFHRVLEKNILCIKSDIHYHNRELIIIDRKQTDFIIPIEINSITSIEKPINLSIFHKYVKKMVELSYSDIKKLVPQSVPPAPEPLLLSLSGDITSILKYSVIYLVDFPCIKEYSSVELSEV